MEDAVAKAAKALKATRGTQQIHDAEWASDQDLLTFRGKYYVPRNMDLR
jgi:hypothetical protein